MNFVFVVESDFEVKLTVSLKRHVVFAVPAPTRDRWYISQLSSCWGRKPNLQQKKGWTLF